MSHLIPNKLFTITKLSINGLVTGPVLIGTTLPNMSFATFGLITEVQSVSGFTSAPTLTIGQNSATYNDIVASFSASASGTVNRLSNPAISNPAQLVGPNTGIFANITAAAVATTYTFNIYLFGFYY